MGRQQAEEAGALRQTWKEWFKIGLCPAVEGTVADAFESKQQAERDHLAWMQHGLRMFLLVRHGIVNTAEQLRGKIVDGHRLGLALRLW